jgi:hypothetical protein
MGPFIGVPREPVLVGGPSIEANYEPARSVAWLLYQVGCPEAAGPEALERETRLELATSSLEGIFTIPSSDQRSAGAGARYLGF